MRMKKILSLLMLALVSIGTAWADTESSGNIGESNVSWIGKSMTLSGDFIADKPAEATEATITVPETITDGKYYYTTFSSDKALDFSDVEGIEAFSVKKNVGGDFMTGYTAKATLTKVEQVPANTGVLIRATAATSYSVPFADGEVAVLEDNDLVANSAKTDMVDLITKDGYNIATIPAVLKLNSINCSTFVPLNRHRHEEFYCCRQSRTDPLCAGESSSERRGERCVPCL